MGRMKDVAIDIEYFLDAGMSAKDIATKTGVPIEQVEDRKAERQQGKERDAAERRQIKEVDAAEKKYRKEKGISPSARGYFHMDGSRGSAGGGGMSPTDIEKGRQPGKVKLAKGGMVKSSASKRADGVAQRGKTRGRIV